MPSSPNDCIFFSHEEKVVAVWRVAHNRMGVKSSKIQWYQVNEAAKDIKIYLIAFLALAIGILNGSVTNFMSSLLKGFGFSSEKTLLYQLPNGAIQFIVTSQSSPPPTAQSPQLTHSLPQPQSSSATSTKKSPTSSASASRSASCPASAA